MSYWGDLNIDVKYVDTKKKFFNKYLYKVIVYAPASNIIVSKSKLSVAEQLEARIKDYEVRKNINRYWADHANSRYLNEASDRQLEYFRTIAKQYNGKIKYRSEEPHLTIYSDDLDLLFDIVSKGPRSYRILEVYKPASADAEAVLNRGEVIIKKPTDYGYKVVFKDGYSFPDGHQVSDYLYNLGDEVKMTKSCIRTLTTKRYWYSGVYFYCKDPSVTTFLNLIAPGCIAGIFKLANLSE